eukprot:CAMPEP_0170297334 /NCGR_PEP_ID=MMETSP0116_2-20130129/48827_1 /TAXON_ID=400756 /ORGANISM="Durinskia baltica, Strain CSIRO CS-38" /LENGTH=64 /DNA_ID=CAMNT_0010548957 /DNA_START=1477 /DNA_END=1667 /DNA_ORIENTATION=-
MGGPHNPSKPEQRHLLYLAKKTANECGSLAAGNARRNPLLLSASPIPSTSRRSRSPTGMLAPTR